MKTFWISFASDAGFRGVIITEAPSEADAMAKINQLAINPGGEAVFFDMAAVPGGIAETRRFKQDTLISAEELNSLGYRRGSEIAATDYDKAMSHSTVLCQDCNKP